MISNWLVLPLVGALIGYITNVVAIRMLFHPRRPIRIPGTAWRIQGLIPMRRMDLARAVGDTVAKDLLPIDSLLDKIDVNSYQQQVVATIVAHVDKRVRTNLPSFIPSALGNAIIAFLCDLAERESGSVLAQVVKNLRERIRNEVRIDEVVEQKVSELDLAALEKLVIRVAKRELRHIELLGGVLGLVIGLVQAGLLTAIR
jgi:uncharacterized membrane protein YheB (UPF0754 family)